MAGQVSRIRSATHNTTVPFSGYPSQSVAQSCELAHSTSCVTAYSVEFVAKPSEVLTAQSKLASSITGTLKGVTGFAGCILMTSDQEARLMTVVTFWRGSERMKHCNTNMRWVTALVAPYMDRKLRVQTMVAQLPAASFLERVADEPDGIGGTTRYAQQENEVCVA